MTRCFLTALFAAALVALLPGRCRAQPGNAAQSGPQPAASSATPITVAELEALIKQSAKRRDTTLARQLYKLRLTERLSTPRLTQLEAALPGVKARAALVALADASVFLALPDLDTLATDPSKLTPDITAQRRIISLTVEYLRVTLPQLPNFFATRTTAQYANTQEDERNSRISVPNDGPVHWLSKSAATVIYRNHTEVVDNGGGFKKFSDTEANGLVTRGTFGPILATVILDAAQSQMTFSHWEAGTAGPQAVFTFSVPLRQSHYEVAYHSLGSSTSKVDDPPSESADAASLLFNLARRVAYHGEIAVDAADGAIYRLAVVANMDPGLSVTRAAIMVEYAPVEIGSKAYICPVRSVSFSEGRDVKQVRAMDGLSFIPGPVTTRLNDVTFTDYHVFRTEMRIITGDQTGDNPTPATKP